MMLWQAAVDQINDWLCSNFENTSQIGRDVLIRYERHSAKFGWRIPIEFQSGTRHFDILVSDAFPFAPPSIVLVERPPHLTWPHIESSGRLCLLPNGATVNFEDPISVLISLLNDAVVWLETSEVGANVGDFRSEFTSYWIADERAPPIQSILNPEGPSRTISVYRLQGLYVVAEDQDTLNKWLGNRFPSKTTWSSPPEKALLIWLDQPFLPVEYPSTAAAIVRLIQEHGLGHVLDDFASREQRRITIVIGARTDNGPVLAGVVLWPVETGQGRGTPHQAIKDVRRGFRPGNISSDVVARRFLGSIRPIKAEVERVDASWIHGRDADPTISSLQKAKVAIVGCGALGSSIALALAQSGVGNLDLIDPEILKSANVGRHALSIAEVGTAKASSLATRIRSHYPHICHVQGYLDRWEKVDQQHPSVLQEANLIISTIGSWSSEGALNAWRQRRFEKPNLIFGWTEPHGVAGHAVGLLDTNSCLACGMSSYGTCNFQISKWPNGTGLRGEPACGVTFQPYGPIEAGHVIALIAEAAVDVLLKRIETTFHRIWVGRESVLFHAGGDWSDAWINACEGMPTGARMVERKWIKTATCAVCGKSII